jgi:hypothetical protein
MIEIRKILILTLPFQYFIFQKHETEIDDLYRIPSWSSWYFIEIILCIGNGTIYESAYIVF